VQLHAAVLPRDREAGLGPQRGLVLHAELVLAFDNDRGFGLRVTVLDEDVLDDVGVICVRDGSSLNELGWTKDNEVKKTGRVADNVVKGKWRQQMRTKARIAEARSQHNQGKQGYQ